MKRRARKRSSLGNDHLVIPDTQIRPGISLAFVEWIRKYILDHRPPVIVQLGDWYDFHSLNSYTKGTAAHLGRTVHEDLRAGNRGLEVLMAAWPRSYRPKKVFLIGNHETRLLRYVGQNPELAGTLGTDKLDFGVHGWEVVPFLKVKTVDGIDYCHYFPRSASGRVMQSKRGAPSAKVQLDREGRSCVAGHMQGLDFASKPIGGKLAFSVIAGSAYPHEESYLSPQGNHHFRGIIHLRNVSAGQADPFFVRLSTLQQLHQQQRRKR